MNISPILNSVKCTVFGRFAQFWDVLEGSTVPGRAGPYCSTLGRSRKSFFKIFKNQIGAILEL